MAVHADLKLVDHDENGTTLPSRPMCFAASPSARKPFRRAP
ncbi:MAG: hypothetical protein ACM3IG_07360 [Myxococcales bacterium]